jgi:tetratricopeptide (TPR) repeat protein
VFSLTAVKQLALSMGCSMALIYIQVLKNSVLSKNYSADVMQKMFALLEMLSNDLPPQDLLDTWSWVTRETTRLHELLSLKQTADQQFKEKSYRAAMEAYTQALQMDITAKRWNAILHCNRAACHMCLNMFSDAVHDCNTAVLLYSDYHRAYLRRARAYRAMDKYNESVRDYRRYLCSDPVPSDFAGIQKELDGMLDEKATETRRQKQQEQEQERRKQEQQRPSSAKSNSFAQFGQENHSQKGNGTFRPRSAHRHNSSTWTSGGPSRQFFEPDDVDWDDEDDDDNGLDEDAFRHQSYQRSFQSHQHHHDKSSYNTSSSSSAYSSSARPNSGPGHSAHSTANANHNTRYQYNGSGHSAHSTANANRNTRYQYNYNHHANNNAGGYTSPRPNNNTSSNNNSNTVLFSLKEKDHYTILGVDTAASDRDIKMAYRKLALQFHPDKNKEDGAEDRFKMISMSYSVLIDKDARREYDLSRPLPRSGRNW